MILAKAPVYKLRLGRPSRLPSMFINFETDPRLCPLPQKHYFLVPTSLNLWHPTPLGCLFGCPLGHPLEHPCPSTTIQLSTIIHLLSPVLPTPLAATPLSPHPSDSASDVRRMSTLWVPCRSELLVTAHGNSCSIFCLLEPQQWWARWLKMDLKMTELWRGLKCHM